MSYSNVCYVLLWLQALLYGHDTQHKSSISSSECRQPTSFENTVHIKLGNANNESKLHHKEEQIKEIFTSIQF